jgi:type I restriction enzyme M protein
VLGAVPAEAALSTSQGQKLGISFYRSSVNLRFEVSQWAAADKLRSNLDAAEYRHVVLGLIFLKFISDTFEEELRWLTAKLEEQFAESARLEKAIRKNLRGMEYGS